MTLRHLPFLGERDFRCLGAATLLNSVGMMGEVVVLGWLTLELTNSPFLVGVAMAARSLPLVFVGIPAGVLADRLPRHRVLVATGIGQAVTASTIGTLALLGAVSVPGVLLVTLAAGTIRGIEHAARQSYTHDVVGVGRLVTAMAILGVAMRVGWLLGSLLVGAVIAHFGSGVAYLAVAAGYLAGGVAVLAASPARGAPPVHPGSVWESVAGFVTAIRADRMLVVLMVLTAGGEMLGFAHQALLPSLARDILRVGPEGLGAMNAARSLGGVLGLAAVVARGTVYGGGALFIAALIAFGATLIGLGVAPYVVGFVGVLIILVVVNGIGALCDLMAQSLPQLAVPADLRGRASGAWVFAIGFGPVGQMQIGALASAFGVTIALAVSGIALLTLAVVTAATFPRLRRL